jgi:four helix bundle protein
VIENPKSEGRSPEEGRRSKAEGSPKAESKMLPSAWCDSDFWNWGNKPIGENLMLREGNGPHTPVSDLGERTALFGEAVVKFAKGIPQGPVNNRLISQLVGAATSIGANYCEADDSISGKEFKQKIGLSRKESKETMFFLRMIAAAEETLAPDARSLWREAKELNLIFGTIWRKP